MFVCLEHYSQQIKFMIFVLLSVIFDITCEGTYDDTNMTQIERTQSTKDTYFTSEKSIFTETQ